MTKNLRLLITLVLLLVVLLMGCGEGSGSDYCNALWADCPEESYMICSRARGLEQSVSGGTRFYSYYNCNTGQYTPTLSVPAECHVSFKY